MLSNKGFDLWADGYDKAVGISDEENTYPFAGYKKVLGFIFQTILASENATVLDIGFGTGTLTTKLYERGCTLYGQDFSSRMIALASEKMPNAHLYQGDFSKGLVEPLRNCRYDFIVAKYSLHHLTDVQKRVFLSELRNHLKENGKIIISLFFDPYSLYSILHLQILICQPSIRIPAQSDICVKESCGKSRCSSSTTK